MKRYNLECTSSDDMNGAMVKSPDGDYVEWEDVAVLIEELSLTNDHEHAILGERDEARKCVAELEAIVEEYRNRLIDRILTYTKEEEI